MSTARRLLTKLAVALSASVLLLLFLELVLRGIGYDFARTSAGDAETPIYFRRPAVPVGDVYYRRQGDQVWEGQVMSVRLRQLAITPDPYEDDPAVTVRYDHEGFRNPPGLSDWEIAVAGDSLTELGHLPDEDLFTNVLANELGVRVKHLGAANTGPLTQLCYLEQFGVAPSTRQVALIFFDGNDRQDTRVEYERLLRFRETGERDPVPQPPEQNSLWRALLDILADLVPTDSERVLRNFVHATFESREGRIELSIHHAPPSKEEIADVWPTIDVGLDYALDAYAAFAEQRGVTAWLFFLPCKLRVYQGLIELTELAPERAIGWKPNDLPEDLRQRCLQRGIRYVDLTEPMTKAAREERVFLFNTIYDTHLNAAGSRFVGHELARHLRE